MSIPNAPAPLPAPPQDEGTASFKTGGLQTFNGLVGDGTEGAGGMYPGTVSAWKRTQSNFGGKVKDQFGFIIVLDAYKDRGELAYYCGTNAVHPKSKLPPFLKAIQRPVPTPEQPSLGACNVPGARANFLVKNERGQDGQLRPKIKEVLTLS